MWVILLMPDQNDMYYLFCKMMFYKMNILMTTHKYNDWLLVKLRVRLLGIINARSRVCS